MTPEKIQYHSADILTCGMGLVRTVSTSTKLSRRMSATTAQEYEMVAVWYKFTDVTAGIFAESECKDSSQR